MQKVRVWVNKECQIKSGVKEENFESELFEEKDDCRWWGVRTFGRNAPLGGSRSPQSDGETLRVLECYYSTLPLWAGVAI